MKNRLSAFLFIIINSLSLSVVSGQIMVYDYNDRATWIGGGETSKQIISGHWIFKVQTDEVIKINIFPSSKKYSFIKTSELAITAVGPKSAAHIAIGYASWQDPEANSFLDYESLIGVARSVKLGGRFGTINVPTSMRGPIFNIYVDLEFGNEIRQGQQNLKFNSKLTQLYNSLEYTAERAQEKIILSYIGKGFRPF